MRYSVFLLNILIALFYLNKTQSIAKIYAPILSSFSPSEIAHKHGGPMNWVKRLKAEKLGYRRYRMEMVAYMFAAFGATFKKK